MISRSSFALDISAGKSSRCIIFFAIFNRQREKILSGFGFFCGNCRSENDCFTACDDNRTICLFRNNSGVKVYLLPAYFNALI